MLFLIITHLWKLLRYDETKLEDDIRGEVTYAWVQAVNKQSAAMTKLQQKVSIFYTNSKRLETIRNKLEYLLQYECCGLDETTDTDKSCFSDEKAIQTHGGGCTIAMQKYCLHIYRIEKLVHSIMLSYEVNNIFSYVLVSSNIYENFFIFCR